MFDWVAPNSEYPPPKPGEPSLHRAARLGDDAEIRRLVSEGAAVDSVFNIGLDPGAREDPATPLMVAAGSGDGASVETVKTLLQLGADAKRVVGGQSAATCACTGLGWNYRPGGDGARLRLLLASGSPLPPGKAARNKMLCEIAIAGDSERLSALLELGVDARGYFDPEEARRSHMAMQERMAAYRESTPDTFASFSPEFRASMEESRKKQEAEILASAVSAPWGDEIPIHCATEGDSVECVRMLLARGADPMARDSAKRTAMYSMKSLAMARALMGAGVPIEDVDDYGCSPLVSAASGGALPRVLALLGAGANANAARDGGYTVFMSAVGSGRRLEVLEALVRAGADPRAVTEDGFSAFHAAIDVDGEANTEQSVRETFGYLKQLGVDIERRTGAGLTPLARAILSGNGVEVRVLCELGANPNAVCPKRRCGDEGCTSMELPLLFHAADGTGVDRDEITDSLLRAGADPLVKDEDGHTPLSHVVAALCSSAEDYETSFRSFYEGLGRLRLGSGSLPGDREAFVAVSKEPIRAYVTEFASKIPVPTTCKFEGGWRQERISCIVALCAYEGWARHEVLRRRSGS